MIWRLTYCNKEGVQARLDIIRGASTPVEVIEGTATPFILNYKLDKTDKSGFFMTSSADISIFETPTFNIDNLKTSSETEIKVEHYINNVLDWSGFVIPDFFSKTIGTPATVEMVASDRLGTLKGVTLGELSQYVSMRDLAVACLAKTGLTLPLYTMADFGNAGQTNAFFKALGLSGRLSDTKGRNISCYDILKSILVASNSKLVQQSGRWYIVNKFQHEQGVGNLFSTLTASTAYSEQTVNFSDVHVGARRSIVPVGATAGVFHEFGGGKEHPENFDFSMGVSGWTNVNGFTATTRSEEVVGYELIGGVYQPIYGGYTSINHLFNLNPAPLSDPTSPRYIKSADIPSPIEGAGSLKITASINATAYKAYPNMPVYVWYTVIAKKDGEVLALDLSGAFVPYVENQSVLERVLHKLSFKPGFTTVDFKAEVDTNSDIITGELAADELSDYTFEVRIYGSGSGSITLINFFSLNISSIKEQPRGSIFKRIQGTGFTKEHDIDTAIFGDYISRGIDGYFYTYAVDDTSSLYSSAGTLTEPLWTAYGDTEQLPLLRHVTRQKSRMFSLAHNMISARIDVATFKPLNIFVDCNSVNPRHVVVSASYDFLRSEVEVELEQIAYATLDVREFIYSYFGEGESGVKSIGGISSGTGGGGSGGGMTADQVAILSEVQVLAHDHGNKEVLDQVTQDVVDNALREMIISTDTETELTDENYLSSLRVLKEILDNNEYLRTQFLSKVNPDTAQKLIKFVEGVEVGTFTTGALGAGAAVKMIDGTSYAEVDNLTVRQKATFRELIIESLKHIGGQLVLTPARMKCVRVVDGGTYYKCYFDTGDGEVSNEFVAGDLARCQVFTGSGTKFYWRLVTLVGEDWINLSKTNAAVGSDAPEAGDDIAQLGNATDTTRQSAIILSTVGIDAPSWKQYSGINSFSLEGKETTVFSKLGNKISGKTVFTSGGANLDDHLDGVAQDILDALRAAQDAEDKAQQAIEDAEADVATINTEIGKLQAQLDGEVSNWFYPYSPTLANYPASDWTTNEIKDRHIGDTFTNTAQAPATDAGKSWRFVKNGSTYSWTLIADSDAVKALLEASKAQATADGKSTTHLFQPTKYKLGDMWVLNADQTVNGIVYKQGDILTATQDSETFVQAHWLKRVRYTDDTAINELQIGGRNLIKNTDLNGIAYKYEHINKSGEGGLQLSSLGFSEPIIQPHQYTISMEIRGVSDVPIVLYRISTQGNSSITLIHNTDLTEEYKKVKLTFTPHRPQLTDLWVYTQYRATAYNAWFEIKPNSIKLEQSNKATDWTPAPEDVQASIDAAKQEALTAAGNAQTSANNANTAVGDLNTYVDGSFKDGVIEASEAKAIEKYINIVNTEKSNIEATYNTLYANTYLEGTPKSDLLNAKVTYFGAVDTLLNSINTAIADGKTTIAEKQAVDANYSSYKTALASLQSAIEEANKAIQTKLDTLSTEKVDNLQIGTRNFYHSKSPISALAGAMNLTQTQKGFTALGNYNFENPDSTVRVDEIINSNGEWTIRFKAKSNAPVALNVDVCDGAVNTFNLTTEFQWYEFTYNVTNFSTTYNFIDFEMPSYAWYYIDDLIVVQGNKAPSSYIEAPEDVQAAIDAEKTRINEILSDNIADPSEKQYLSNLWQEIYAEYPRIWAQANTYAVDKSNYEAKYSALNTLLSPVLANLTTNSTVSGSSIRTAFSQYYDARTVLQNAITNKVNQNAVDVDAKAQALEYLKQAIGQDAVVDGALYTIVTLLLKEDMNAQVTAGISGIRGAAKDEPAFWAGGTDLEAQQGTAKAIIRHDGTSKFTDGEFTGTVYATDGEFTGKITASTGDIGPFGISAGQLEATSGYDSMLLSANLIRFTGQYSSVYIGADTFPASNGGAILGTHRISVNRTISGTVYGNVGLYINITGSKSYDDAGLEYTGNHALYIPKGSISGVRFGTKRVNGTSYLSVLDTNVIVVANNTTIWLPNNPEDGQMYWINPNGYSGVTVRSYQNMWDNGGSEGTSISIQSRVWQIFIYDRVNSTWLYSWTNG